MTSPSKEVESLPVVAWLMDTEDDASWAELDDLMSGPPELPTGDAVKRVVPLVTLESAQTAIDIAVERERERIADAVADALQADLEHGVKWLSEKAAAEFAQKYPELGKVLAAIRGEGK